MKTVFFALLITVIVLSCADNKAGEASLEMPDSGAVTKVDTTPKIEADQSRGTYVKITPKAVIKVLSLQKELDNTAPSYDKFEKQCANWKLNENDVKKILMSSQEIDGHEFHNFYSVLPCTYSGKVEINGKEASYEINAGAVTTLLFKDSSIWLGYKNKNYKKYFLQGRDTEEEK